MTTVSIIIPVWNRADLTNSFLYNNWLLYRNKSNVEFIIVNNGSTDNTKAVLVQWQDRMGERLKVIHSDENLGFSGGNNLGVAHSKADILIFTSNDVKSTGDYVSIVETQVKNEFFALYGAKLLNYDTGWNTFQNVVYSYLEGYFIAMSEKIYNDWGDGVCWDNDYFPCDYEDIDLSMQAVKNGIELIPLNLPIQHTFGQSAQNIEGGRLAVTLESKAKFMKKWDLVE